MNEPKIKTFSELFSECETHIERKRALVKRWEFDPENQNDTILSGFGTWIVSTAGVECIGDSNLNPQYYFIERERLPQQDWPLHMEEKTWIVLWDFLRAFYWARHHFHPEQYPSLEKLGMERPREI